MKNLFIGVFIIAMTAFGCKNKEATDKQDSPKNQTFDTLSTENVQAITNTYWKLIMLDGQEVVMDKNQERESYFMLKTEPKKLTGFSGCNSFSGSYTLEGPQIRFSKIASTMKACPDVNVDESKFLNVFELANNYTLHDDTLSLNVGKRAPLAVFKAVYFQ